MAKYKKISKVLIWIFFSNLIVAVIKLGFGYFLNINSLTADGFHALTDTLSNIIGITGIKFAAKPADKDHPYGYQKFETIAGMIIGFLLVVIIIRIITNVINYFLYPSIIEISTFSLIALIITIIINIFVAVIEYRAGKKLKSDVFISDSIHTRSDIFISFGVLITMVLVKFGFPSIIDPILSLIIALFIFKSAYEIFKMTVGVLVDKNVVDRNQIVEIIKRADNQVIDVHKIRSRGKMDQIFIDLHIITDPNLTVKEAHDLSHKLENVLQESLEKYVDLVCHIEPNER